MLHLTLLDGRTIEMPREEALALLPCDRLLRNPHLKADAIYCHEGRLLPVTGPLPDTFTDETAENGIDQRPWLLLRSNGLQVVRGLPRFADETKISLSPTSEAPVAQVLVMPTRIAPANPPAPASEADEEARLLAELEDLLESA